MSNYQVRYDLKHLVDRLTNTERTPEIRLEALRELEEALKTHKINLEILKYSTSAPPEQESEAP